MLQRAGVFRLLATASCSPSVSGVGCTSSTRRSASGGPEEAAPSVRPPKSDALYKSAGKAKVVEKKSRGIFGTSDVPININFPNQKGVLGYDPEISIKEALNDLPSVARQQAKLIKEELAATEMSIEKVELLEDIGMLRHNEARIEYTFDTDEALALWHTGCDADWDEGYSKVEWNRTDHGTAVFSGNTSTKVMRDGRVERAGWASVKLEDKKALLRKKYLTRWKNFTHLLVKCRGDGRSYKMMLHAPQAMDFTWGDSFSYPLHTHGGPYWQYEKIPFSKFFHTVNGRIQDRQYPVDLGDVSSLGIVLMDRIDGPFRLELACIGVYNDRSHVEKFAYETYTLPLFNTHGF